MEEKKLTDEEIVKAYKYCVLEDGHCNDCPYEDYGCAISAQDILDLINRQKAEIERLKENNEEQQRIIFGLEEEKQLLLKRLDEEFVSLKAVKAGENSPSAIKLLVKSICCVQKDTAKEILDELDLYFKGTTFRKGYEFKKIEKKLKEIAERKGVEVE